MSLKLFLLSIAFILSYKNVNKEKKPVLSTGDRPTDCSVCYFMGQATAVGGTTPSGVQTCVLGSNRTGAVWVNNGANIIPATCNYCQLQNLWYSEGALNGSVNPVTYCRNGQWIH